MFARFFARDQLDDAQRQRRRAAADRVDRVERQRSARAFGAEKEDLVERLIRAGLEQRENRADGFADTGWRLGHQAAAVASGSIHRFGQLALAGAKRGVRKTQWRQRLISLRTMRDLAIGPAQKLLAQRLEELLQLQRGVVLRQRGLGLA